MTPLYVVEIGWPYEGRNAVGVYDDIELARAAALAIHGECGEAVYVTEFVPNAPAEWPASACWEWNGDDWKRT